MPDADRTERRDTDSTVGNPPGSGDYIPPTVEDVDTTHAPMETATGVMTRLGAEESARWH